ncbi:transmembrane protein 254-like [Diadema antillarum]|uniref:transmembrane protein 254-like n=1 Tax=Diadema antillarum TaxID=105358 RepID=UPI003A8B41B2
MPSVKQTNYFVYPNVIGMIAVTLGLLLTALCTFKRDIVPYDYLGPISELAYFLAYKQPVVMRAICYTAIFMHVLEGCYAYYLAGMKGISGSARTKWFIFTLLFGIVSMYRLLQYNPTRAQKRD